MNTDEKRNEVIFLLNMARNKAVEKNDYKPIYWKDVAKTIGIDTGNLSKIVTGVIDTSASTFVEIIDALGMYIKIAPKGDNV